MAHLRSHRLAISDRRPISVDEASVTVTQKNYQIGDA